MQEASESSVQPRAGSPSGESTSCVALRTRPQGCSVVTTCDVESSQVLLVFEGILSPHPGKHSLQVGAEQHLVSPEPEATWQFINHSCRPNCWIEFGPGPGDVRLVARIRLAPDQEVTFNYLTTEWDLATPFPCSCAVPSCLGWIRGARHLDDAQLAALGPDLAPHLRALLRASGRLPSSAFPAPPREERHSTCP